MNVGRRLHGRRPTSSFTEAPMIILHRLTHPDQPLHLNPDLILTVEAHPDTVVTLTNSTRFVVGETPEQVTTAVREWKASVLALAMSDDRQQRPLAKVVDLPERKA
jgi:flagellar protein FlbD